MQFESIPSFVDDCLLDADRLAFDVKFEDSSIISGSLFGDSSFSLRYANLNSSRLSEVLQEVTQNLYQEGYICSATYVDFGSFSSVIVRIHSASNGLPEGVQDWQGIPHGYAEDCLFSVHMFVPLPILQTGLTAFINGVHSCQTAFHEADFSVFFRRQQSYYTGNCSVVM